MEVMDRAEIEKLLDDTMATAPADLRDRVSPADRERAIQELQQKFDRRDAGIIDFREEREIRIKLEYFRRWLETNPSPPSGDDVA
jgi:hypothetical protein